MLKLKRIKVEGFRNINNVSLELSKMNALVGLNASGKSNILDAIQFGMRFITDREDDKERLMKRTDCIPINKVTQNKNFSFEIEGEIEYENQIETFVYGYELIWSKKSTDDSERVNSEWLKSKDQQAKKFSALINRKRGKSLYKSSVTGRCDNSIQIKKNNLIINKLEAFDGLFFSHLVKSINQVNTYVERSMDTRPSYIKDYIIPRDFSELDLNLTNNIPRVIYFLERDYHEKYNVLIDAYTNLFPNLSNVEVAQIDIKPSKVQVPDDAPFIISENVFSLYVKDETLNQPVDFARLSDGCKRVLLMLTRAVWADIKKLPLIAFEEPENSVHPALMQDYLSILSQLSGDCKIILTSHSPYIIECLDPKAINVSVPNFSGQADFKRFAKNKMKQMYKEAAVYSSSAGDYIFELLSGTEEDHRQLSGYLEK